MFVIVCFFLRGYMRGKKGKARCWRFLSLRKAEWCCITKSLLKGWGLSIITAAAFMFSLASVSLHCHRWPFVPYQRRLWSSGAADPDTHWHRLIHTYIHAHPYTFIKILFGNMHQNFNLVHTSWFNLYFNAVLSMFEFYSSSIQGSRYSTIFSIIDAQV